LFIAFAPALQAPARILEVKAENLLPKNLRSATERRPEHLAVTLK
jgi:hypothetical protein